MSGFVGRESELLIISERWDHGSWLHVANYEGLPVHSIKDRPDIRAGSWHTFCKGPPLRKIKPPRIERIDVKTAHIIRLIPKSLHYSS
jgi:hypothetical protein